MSNFPLSDTEISLFLEQALLEDLGDGDITCALVIEDTATLTATMHARQDMVLAGLLLAERCFKQLDETATFKKYVKDGDTVKAGMPIMTIHGKARALLSAERVSLNIVQYLSGIATLTKDYMEQISHTKVKLLDTRKTLPSYRKLAKYATQMGGATNHRMGLFDAVMIKDNHIAVVGDMAKAITAAKATGRKDVQVECDTLSQVSIALKAGADSLLLDNMDCETLKKAVTMVAGKIPLEASGGVTLDTIKAIAETGVDYISVGRLTSSAPAIDIGLDYSV